MNDISIDLIQHLKDFMFRMNREADESSKYFNEHTLYIEYFNEFIFQSSIGNETEVTNKKSPLYIYKMLNTRPERSLKYFKEHYTFYNTKEYLEITKKDQYKRTIIIIIQFLNIATYLYNNAFKKNLYEKDRENLLKILTVAATAEYESLYSSRGKNEFAYYFEKFLTVKQEQTIRPYNTDEHRQIYSKLTSKFKKEIDMYLEESENGDKFAKIGYSNLNIYFGQKKDNNFLKFRMRYFISIDMPYLTATGQELNQIFNTNFK